MVGALFYMNYILINMEKTGITQENVMKETDIMKDSMHKRVSRNISGSYPKIYD